MKTALAKILIPLITVSFLGCTAALIGGGAAGGVATYKYLSGKLIITYQYPYDQVWKATVKAVKDLNFKVEYSAHDALEGKIKCQSATGKKIKIQVKRIQSKITQVSIKVGLFGNLDFSLQIKEKIDSNLKIK